MGMDKDTLIRVANMIRERRIEHERDRDVAGSDVTWLTHDLATKTLQDLIDDLDHMILDCEE